MITWKDYENRILAQCVSSSWDNSKESKLVLVLLPLFTPRRVPVQLFKPVMDNPDLTCLYACDRYVRDIKCTVCGDVEISGAITAYCLEILHSSLM